MRSKRFVLVCVCALSLAASLRSEQWYRVSETELSRLETISQGWETDRQTWLSRASELKGKVQTLQQESKTLNAQLAGERETTANLRKSFEKSASDQLTKASEYETEIASLRELKSKAEIAMLKAKNQRNILFFVLSALVGSLSVWVFLKLSH
jgi:hypothetical protein